MSNQKVNSTGKKNARLDKSKKLITQYKKGKKKRKPDSVATSLVTLGQDTKIDNLVLRRKHERTCNLFIRKNF